MSRTRIGSFLFVVSQLVGIAMLYSTEDKARYDYYNQIFERFYYDVKVKLMMDDRGLFLKTTDQIHENNFFFHIPIKLVIQGCLSYPFKDEIATAIENYYLTHRPNKARLTQIYLLAYQILYYQFADHEAVKNILFKQDYISDVVSWKPTPLMLEYIKILYKSKINSIFSLSEAEIKWGESLGFDLTAYYEAKEIFSAVKQVALKIEDADIGDLMLSFVSSETEFHNALKIVIKHSMIINHNSVTIEDRSPEFEDLYQKEFLKRRYYLEESCFILAPGLDLNRVFGKVDDYTNIMVGTNHALQHYLFAVHGTILEKNTTVQLKPAWYYFEPHKQLLDYGILDWNSYVLSVDFEIDPETLKQEHLELCATFAPCPIMHKVYTSGITKSTANFLIEENYSQPDLIRLHKLMQLNWTLFHQRKEHYMLSFRTQNTIDYPLQMKGLSSYYQSLSSQNKAEFGKLIEDFFNLKSIIKNIRHRTPAFVNSIRNIKRLTKFALKRERAIEIQKSVVLDQISKAVLDSLSKLKERELNLLSQN